jgi:hypothetical protein
MAETLGNHLESDSPEVTRLKHELHAMPEDDRARIAEQLNVVASGISHLATMDAVVDVD